MPPFKVYWEIDVEEVETPEEAAQKALDIQRDPTSIATVFKVVDEETGAEKLVDLWQEKG